MGKRPLTILVAAAALLLLQGCSTTPRSASPMELAATQDIPAADPALDHYIAWVPREQAQTATVAKAMTHITIGNAREQAGERHCAGAWIQNDKLAGVVGPIRAWAPAGDGGYPAWYYRVSHKPGLQGCGSIDNPQLYRTLQAGLPEWLSVRTAGSASAAVTAASTLSLLE